VKKYKTWIVEWEDLKTETDLIVIERLGKNMKLIKNRPKLKENTTKKKKYYKWVWMNWTNDWEKLKNKSLKINRIICLNLEQ
jgi:hypothetical protein